MVVEVEVRPVVLGLTPESRERQGFESSAVPDGEAGTIRGLSDAHSVTDPVRPLTMRSQVSPLAAQAVTEGPGRPEVREG